MLPGLLFAALTAWTLGDADGHLTFVSERSLKSPQKLSKYSWYANARLQKFHIPEGTAIARWLFTVTKGRNLSCGRDNVTIHLSWGSPPVINLENLELPNSTFLNPSLSLPLPATSESYGTLNLTDPAAGDWFIAAHLPNGEGRIEQKGFPSCSYFFQPQLSIRRAVDTPVLLTGTVLQQTAGPDRPARLKFYVPELISSLVVSVADCSVGGGTETGACSLILRVGSVSLRQDRISVSCSGMGCSAPLAHPPWRTWLHVVVETRRTDHNVTFSISLNQTVGCELLDVGLAPGDDFFHNSSLSNATDFISEADSRPAAEPGCVQNVGVLQQEEDTLSIRFVPAKKSNVSVSDARPTMLAYPIPTHANGGTLNLELTLNKTNATLDESAIVVACFTPWSPILELNLSLPCDTALFGGYKLTVNSSSPEKRIRLPFPLTTTWYLTMQLTCNGSSNCRDSPPVVVTPLVFVSPCVDECGPYGECRLLRSHSYLYSACSCRAGWRGWGCTDSSTAHSYSLQLTSVLLLTLSNLSFLPAIVVAANRLYLTEASVYLTTMFFSTFYHACDQPGVTVMCIMEYDTLQYCDFLGSICSVWVTVLCMARIADSAKYTLFMVGALLIAMSLQLDRKGLWNLLGPILCAVLFMTATWVFRGVRRRRCYPPSWRRWVFYLLPGFLCAVIGLLLYAFAATEKNYFYVHSLWHILVAGCVVFLLPPREKDKQALGWTRGWSWRPRVCGYTLCQSSKDKLYTVT